MLINQIAWCRQDQDEEDHYQHRVNLAALDIKRAILVSVIDYLIVNLKQLLLLIILDVKKVVDVNL